jgi:hypothetical protein
MHFEYNDFYTDMSNAHHYLSGLQNMHPKAKVSEYDVQMQIVKHYRKNRLLKECVKHPDKNAVMNELLTLDEDMRGFRRFLPRRVIKAYNERVGTLADLVPASAYLTRRGLLYPDNAVTGALYGGAGIGEAMYWIVRAVGTGDGDPEFAKDCAKLSSIVMSIIGAVGIGAAAQSVRDGRKEAIVQAEYVNGAIADFDKWMLELF